MSKIGIMGGTFNPIHNGHLFLAENAFEQAELDKILFMPAKNPPHKAKLKLITDRQRAEMVKLAIQDNPNFELSEMELWREGFTYTADTLTLLKKDNPQNHYHFIVGTDSLFMMQSWRKPEVIFGLCTVVVAGRDNAEEEQIMKHIKYLKETFGADIMYVKMPMIMISSEDIRQRIAEGRSVRYFLPDRILEYIHKNKLYMTDQEAVSYGFGTDTK